MTEDKYAPAVRQTPVACFVAEPSEPAARKPVRLLDLSYDPGGDGIALRAWDFGDGSTSVEQEPTHRYERDGALHRDAARHSARRAGRRRRPCRSRWRRTTSLTRIAAPWRAARGRAGEGGRDGGKPTYGRDRADRALPATRGARMGVRRDADAPDPAGASIEAPFTVSFDDEDAEVGHVTFGARATLVGAHDATTTRQRADRLPDDRRPRATAVTAGGTTMPECRGAQSTAAAARRHRGAPPPSVSLPGAAFAKGNRSPRRPARPCAAPRAILRRRPLFVTVARGVEGGTSRGCSRPGAQGARRWPRVPG